MSYVDIAIGSSSSVVVITAFGTVFRHLVVRLVESMLHAAFDKLREEVLQGIREDVSELKLQFAKETGGNSNGLRQAVNDIATRVARIEGALNANGTPKAQT